MVVLILVLASFLLLLAFKKTQKINGPSLPPGSFGWPYFGETLKLYSQNPNVFFQAKQKRYGDIFKTHILGSPSVMIANPEAAKFILSSHAHLFKVSFPSNKTNIIGPNAFFFHEGEYHKRLRKLVQKSFMPDSISPMLPDFEKICLDALMAWDGQTINTFNEMKKLTFNIGLLQILGNHDSFCHRDDLNKAYQALVKGYNSFPINIVGTSYNKAMKARKYLHGLLSRIICERRNHGLSSRDLLSVLMGYQDEYLGKLKDEQVADNIIGIMFAAQDTTASVLTWLLKFLGEDPTLLQAVTLEQEAILHQKDEHDQSLSWADTRNMPLTFRVVQETLRLSSILSFTFRETVQDVEYNGYIIPKGWKVMPLFRNIHHNPVLYQDPLKFDPSRFEESLKPNSYLPFGSGLHSCPGNELAKLEILVLIHHLTTKYRWKFDCSIEGVDYKPFPIPKHGLIVDFSHR